MLQDTIRKFPLYIFLELMYILTPPFWDSVFRQISVLEKRPTNIQSPGKKGSSRYRMPCLAVMSKLRMTDVANGIVFKIMTAQTSQAREK
jgi:hypothetical protein